MGIRLLHSRGGYLWCAFLVLASFSSIAQSSSRYADINTAKIVKNVDTAFATHRAKNAVFSSGVVNTVSTFNAGKQLTIPATAALASTAGKAVMKFARITGPISIGTELLSYVLANATLEVFENDFVKEVNTDNGEEITWLSFTKDSPNCPNPGVTTHTYSGPSSCTEMASRRTAAYSACGWGTAPGMPITYDDASRKCLFADGSVYHSLPHTVTQGAPSTEVIDLSPEDWDVIEELDTLPPLTDTEAGILSELDPLGAPVEAPTHPTLPAELPINDAHQQPGADPSTGQWWQDIVRVTPGPEGKVKVEEKIVPVSGPAGIEEPVPYSGPETEQDLDTGEPTPVTIVEGDTTIEVQICEPGDTRLMCTELGTPPEEEVPSDVFDLTWDHAPVVFSEGACPAGPSAMTPWGDVTFDMYWPCEFAKAIKPIILVCAMFAAIYIFITGLRTD